MQLVMQDRNTYYCHSLHRTKAVIAFHNKLYEWKQVNWNTGICHKIWPVQQGNYTEQIMQYCKNNIMLEKNINSS